MPGWLQPVAEWNPMSSLAAACRQLFGNPNPASAVHVWPAQHPELAVLCWSLGMLAIFAPLAVRMYQKKTH
jgi:ABC-2 type transport system permease protein